MNLPAIKSLLGRPLWWAPVVLASVLLLGMPTPPASASARSHALIPYCNSGGPVLLVVLWENKNEGGEYCRLFGYSCRDFGKQTVNVPSLFNDRTSSVWTPPSANTGCSKLTLFEHTNHGGRSWPHYFDTGGENVPLAMNDKASSLTVE
jgi:hypothetical protein